MPTARRPPSPTARAGAGAPRAAGTPQRSTARAPRARAAAPTRPAGRPGPATPAGGGPAVTEQIRLPRLFTARAMVLSVVAGLAFVLVYPTLHAYVVERAKLNTLNAQVAAAERHNADLDNDLQRWQDPAYVTSQARERLAFVMPGERAFRVVDPGSVKDTPTAAAGPAGAVQTSAGQPWYSSVWQSVQVAGTSVAAG